jgi:NADH-quinone oxidoreductase subunit H
MAILRILVLMTKILLVILFFMLARWSWPRFRFDQLMNLSWKVMLPLGLVNLVVVAVLVEVGGQTLETGGRWLLILPMWVVAAIAFALAGLLAPLHTDNRPKWLAERDGDGRMVFPGRPVT